MLAQSVVLSRLILLSLGSLWALCKGDLSKLEAILLLRWRQCKVEDHTILFYANFTLERIGRTSLINVFEYLTHHFLEVVTLKALFRSSIQTGLIEFVVV